MLIRNLILGSYSVGYSQEKSCHMNASKSLSILNLRRLMSYIYMEHPFLMFLDHTQRRSRVGRTPLDE